MTRYRVGMAEWQVAAGDAVLSTTGLGSCVAVALYDPLTRVGGLAHIMLPESSKGMASSNPGKFVDTALPLVMAEIERRGGRKQRLVAKMAGGAQMFVTMAREDFMRIGERNVAAVAAFLQENRVPLQAKETGGSWGRNVDFFLSTGKMTVKTVQGGEIVL